MNIEQLKTAFDYKDGNLYWKISTSNVVKIGDKAGYIRKDGYVKITFNKKCYLLHRLIFAFHHGYLPKMLDHIDGNPSNNKIENLREANDFQNSWNKKVRPDSVSGIKGVWKNYKKWGVTIQANKKVMYFGSFEDLELAELVAIEARNKYHGEFAQ